MPSPISPPAPPAAVPPSPRLSFSHFLWPAEEDQECTYEDRPASSPLPVSSPFSFQPPSEGPGCRLPPRRSCSTHGSRTHEHRPLPAAADLLGLSRALRAAHSCDQMRGIGQPATSPRPHAATAAPAPGSLIDALRQGTPRSGGGSIPGFLQCVSPRSSSCHTQGSRGSLSNTKGSSSFSGSSSQWMLDACPSTPRSPGFGSGHGSQVVSQQQLRLERKQQQLQCATANDLPPQPPPSQPKAIKAPPADCPPLTNAGRGLSPRKALTVPTVPAAPATATAPKIVSCPPTPRCRDCDSRCR